MSLARRGAGTERDAALDVAMRLRTDRVEVEVGGAFVAGGRKLFAAFSTSACNAGRPSIVFDLKSLHRCDLSGLSGLVDAIRDCRANGRLVAVVGASDDVRCAVEAAGLQDVLVES